MEPQIDLVADLNAEDDDGLGWSTLSEARDPRKVQPGAMLVADGRVHFTILPGWLEKNRHLLGQTAV
jgi:hypothetical protein